VHLRNTYWYVSTICWYLFSCNNSKTVLHTECVYIIPYISGGQTVVANFMQAVRPCKNAQKVAHRNIDVSILTSLINGKLCPFLGNGHPRRTVFSVPSQHFRFVLTIFGTI